MTDPLYPIASGAALSAWDTVISGELQGVIGLMKAKPFVMGVVVGSLLMGAATGTSVWAAGNGGATTYHACLAKGLLSHVGTKVPTCYGSAKQISWNSQGPQGVQGTRGPQGAKGEPGTLGAAGPQGDSVPYWSWTPTWVSGMGYEFGPETISIPVGVWSFLSPEGGCTIGSFVGVTTRDALVVVGASGATGVVNCLNWANGNPNNYEPAELAAQPYTLMN